MWFGVARKNKFKIFMLCCLIYLLSIIPFVYGEYNEDVHLKLADEYTLKSRQFYEKAVNEYQLAKKDKNLNQKEIAFRLGKLYYEYGYYDKSVDELNPIYQVYPMDYGVSKILAFAYFKAGNYTDALTIFAKWDERADSDFLFFYAMTCEKQNLYDTAITIYKKIDDINYRKKVDMRLQAINSVTKNKTSAGLNDKKLEKIIQNAPSGKEYPNAGAIILIDEEELEILDDGTAVNKKYVVVKILNDRGKHFGEIELGYDSTYEKVELEYARVIKKDGTVINVGEKNIRDVSKYLDFPLYSNARVKIISMPEVAEDVIIEYKAKWFIGKLIDKKHFYSRYGVQSDEPYIQQIFTLVVPRLGKYKVNINENNPGYVSYNGFKLKPKIKRENEKDIYIWQFDKIPEIISESYMPPWTEIVPNFYFSSFDSWQEIYEWWWRISKEKINYDDQIKEKVKELVKNKKTEKEKAAAIYHFCASKIRYVGIEYGEAGFEPHYATEIFQNKYGDCKDQSILLVSMLRLANIKAYPVLIGTKGYWILDEKFPAPAFNHCIAAADIDGSLIYMDPTVDTATFGDLPSADQCRGVFVFYDDRYLLTKIPFFKPERNEVKISIKINVLEDESILAERILSAKGDYEMSLRNLKYTKPVLCKEMLKEKVNEICPGGELLSYEISDLENLEVPANIEMKFKGPNYLKKAGDNYLVPQLGGISTGFLSQETRTYPLDFVRLDAKETIVEIKLPQNYTIKYLPESVDREDEFFKYKSVYKCENNNIYFYEQRVIKKDLVDVNKYREFKYFFEKIARDIDKQIVLEKNKIN